MMSTLPLIRSLTGLLLGVLVSFVAHAQCAPGTTMYYSSTNAYCGPDPNYRAPQQATQRPTEQWEDRWGAIAIDGTNGVLGTATGMKDKASIERAAMADCQAKGGTACKLDLSYRNSCVAVVTGDTGHNSGTNPSLNTAVSNGIKTCVESGDRNCRTYYTNCSMPVRNQ